MPRLSPYAVVAVGMLLVIAGLIIAAFTVGRWGVRRALRKGRACAVCGLWGTEMDVIIHECLEHEREQDP